jgi:hypothetical protein
MGDGNRGSALVRVAAAVLLAPLGSATLVASAPGETRCSEDAVLGRLCVTQRDNGYDVTYQNHKVCDCVDFNLQTSDGTYGDEGAFWTRPDQYNSYFFAVGYKSSARACLYSRNSTFPPFCTPSVYG